MPSAFEKIQKLQEQIEAAKAEAVEELREKRKEAAAALADIDRQIAALTGEKAAKTAIKRQRDPNKPCKVCGELGHDARKHRGDKK
jgi:DNA repair exonuclease SbcCD ATPase subunit